MADTRQVVAWALEMACAFRTGPDFRKPNVAIDQVSDARLVSKGLADRPVGFGVYDDVIVTSYTTVDGIPPTSARYPRNGFLISKAFAQTNGLEEAQRMCGSCVANTDRRGMAGCCGSIYQAPWSRETQEQLEGIISRLGLAAKMAEAFPKTTPIWYGLWAVSPVPRASLETLRILLSEMLREDRMESSARTNGSQFKPFEVLIRAIELAEVESLNLHVQLYPPGHTDFGLYTVFPHCPFCKAEAKVERWQRKYPTAFQECEVCGTRFSPAETASARRMDFETDDLRNILGQERFEELAKEYLAAQDKSEIETKKIIETAEEAKRLVNEKLRVQREAHERERKFIYELILAGVPRTAPPPSEILGEEEEKDLSKSKWFDGDHFAQALQMCIDRGIEVWDLQHHSVNRDTDQYLAGKVDNPMPVFEQWRREGCNEKFYAHFRVPKGMNVP